MFNKKAVSCDVMRRPQLFWLRIRSCRSKHPALCFFTHLPRPQACLNLNVCPCAGNTCRGATGRAPQWIVAPLSSVAGESRARDAPPASGLELRCQCWHHRTHGGSTTSEQIRRASHHLDPGNHPQRLCSSRRNRVHVRHAVHRCSGELQFR